MLKRTVTCMIADCDQTQETASPRSVLCDHHREQRRREHSRRYRKSFQERQDPADLKHERQRNTTLTRALISVIYDPSPHGFKPGAKFNLTDIRHMLTHKHITPGSILKHTKTKVMHKVVKIKGRLKLIPPIKPQPRR